MSNGRLGENIAREWEEEPRAQELWDAFQLLKFNSVAGLSQFEALAELGSRLAQMYLGSYRISGKYGVPKDRGIGEFWLKCSAERGSIEASYGLARTLMMAKRIDEAREYYEKIGALGYAPAFFALGSMYHTGRVVEKNTQRALAYLEKAERPGHLRAACYRCRILMGPNSRAFVRVGSMIRLIALMVKSARFAISYPASDRLR
jgi:TPR repeat protein